jgi:hypothetical protein
MYTFDPARVVRVTMVSESLIDVVLSKSPEMTLRVGDLVSWFAQFGSVVDIVRKFSSAPEAASRALEMTIHTMVGGMVVVKPFAPLATFNQARELSTTPCIMRIRASMHAAVEAMVHSSLETLLK